MLHNIIVTSLLLEQHNHAITSKNTHSLNYLYITFLTFPDVPCNMFASRRDQRKHAVTLQRPRHKFQQHRHELWDGWVTDSGRPTSTSQIPAQWRGSRHAGHVHRVKQVFYHHPWDPLKGMLMSLRTNTQINNISRRNKPSTIWQVTWGWSQNTDVQQTLHEHMSFNCKLLKAISILINWDQKIYNILWLNTPLQINLFCIKSYLAPTVRDSSIMPD